MKVTFNTPFFILRDLYTTVFPFNNRRLAFKWCVKHATSDSFSLVGGVSSSKIQLTCFQIIYRQKMKIKSSNKSSFHSLAYKEKDSVKRWEGKPHCAGSLKSYFQFTKCVIWLGKWAGMCIRSAGNLIKEMPSLLPPFCTALASTSDLKQSGWLNPKENSINFYLKFSLIWSLLLCVIPKKKERNAESIQQNWI